MEFSYLAARVELDGLWVAGLINEEDYGHAIDILLGFSRPE